MTGTRRAPRERAHSDGGAFRNTNKERKKQPRNVVEHEVRSTFLNVFRSDMLQSFFKM